MKKLLAVLLALLILGVGAAFGETTNKNFKLEGNTLVKYNGPGGEVTVPEGITVLGEWAFEDSGVTKVNLPESLEEIKSYCFFSCEELKEVTIPAGTKKISEAQVFAYCHNLPAINVEEGNTEYVSVDGVLFTADRKTLMYYPDGKKTEIYFIPEGTEQLGRSLFNKPVNLRAVVIPATLRGLENKNHFSCNPKLESIIVSYDCKKYRTFNGALYDNNGNELIAYPSGKTVESVGKDDFLQVVVSFKRTGRDLPDSVRYFTFAFFRAQHVVELLVLFINHHAIFHLIYGVCRIDLNGFKIAAPAKDAHADICQAGREENGF